VAQDAATWLNGARRAAGLSQRELAVKSGVPQSAIARIERGRQVPRVDTLERLLRVCGFQLEMVPKRGEGVDRTLIWHALSQSPAERAEQAAAYGRFIDTLRRARRVQRPAS
jgi:transcriptional regulator with XRE-family HTH domain